MFEIEKNVKNMPEMNDALKLVTEKIDNYQKIAKNSILAISMILADVSEKPNNYLENSGFTTIAEYAETMFGYKKAYTYKLIKISKFVSITDNNGEKLSVEYLLNDSKLLELAENNNSLRINVLKDSDGFEYSTSQMLELLPLSSEQIQNHLIELDSSLSCKELRKIVKDIINPPIEVKVTETDTESDTEEQKEEENTPEIVLTDNDRILKMLEICSEMENDDIKNKIINVFQKALKQLDKF